MKLAIGSCGLSICCVLLLGDACGVNEAPNAPVDVETAASALSSSGDGAAYASQCAANHVPLPLPWGTDTLGTGPGKWDQTGHMYPGDPWLTPQNEGDVFTMEPAAGSPPGICALFVHVDGLLSVICQGTNGMACFWEANQNFWPSIGRFPPPPAIINPPLVIAGSSGIPSANDPNTARCTDCHAGENAFITHANLDAPTNENLVPGWMPTAWYTPIVPATWTQNPGPSTVGYPSQCLGCHNTPNASVRGGRFPLLRNSQFNDGVGFCTILKTVVNLPTFQGGMPPSQGGPDCTPDVNCSLQTDSAVKAMVDACGKPILPTTVPTLSQINGLGPPYGVGTQFLSTKMHVSQSARGMHQHFFTGAKTTMPNAGCCTHENSHQSLASDDTINVSVYLPTGDAPSEIMLQVFDGTNWFRAYWGDDDIAWSPRTRIGNVPATGSWQPLAFRPAQIGMSFSPRLTGIAYTLFNGSAYWADTLFRQTASPYLDAYVSQMWVQDSLPPGAVPQVNGDTWTFVTHP